MHRVVVIGAGFGGLNVVRSLRDAPVHITVVDANNFHTFQPLLYQVATAGLSADDVAHPVRSIYAAPRSSPVETVMGRVVAINTETRTVTTDNDVSVDYDTLVVAAGAVSNDFGIDGVESNAFALKSVDDALALNRHLISNLERASREADAGALPDGALDVVIAGGGPTGVELAGGIAELYQKVLADDFAELPVREARIVIVEMADRLLAPFSRVSSRRAHRTLESLGVEIRTGVGVEEVEEQAVRLDDGSHIPARTIVWAAGVKASPLAEALGVELGHGGRIPVANDLSVVGLGDVFAVGDIAGAADGDALPQLAQPAIQGGKHVAEQIMRRVHGEPTETFHYRDKGSMATIGRHSAVADLPGGIHLGGLIGWVSWLVLHLVYLIGFRNRLVVFVNWCWNYLTFDRPARLLSGQAAAVDRQLVARSEDR